MMEILRESDSLEKVSKGNWSDVQDKADEVAEELAGYEEDCDECGEAYDTRRGCGCWAGDAKLGMLFT